MKDLRVRVKFRMRVRVRVKIRVRANIRVRVRTTGSYSRSGTERGHGEGPLSHRDTVSMTIREQKHTCAVTVSCTASELLLEATNSEATNSPKVTAKWTDEYTVKTSVTCVVILHR